MTMPLPHLPTTTVIPTDELTPGDEIRLVGGMIRTISQVQPHAGNALAVYFTGHPSPVSAHPTSMWERISTVEHRAEVDPLARRVVGRLFVTLYGTAREDRVRVQHAAEATFSGPEFAGSRFEVTDRTVVPPDGFRGFGEATMWEVRATVEKP